MTVTTELSSVTRLWTGAETVISTGLPAASAADIRVSYMDGGAEVELIAGVHFRARLAPADARTAAPVEIIPLSMPTPPRTLTIERQTPATQPLALATGFFDPETLELQLDRDALRDSERRSEIDRSLKVRRGQTPPELDMAAFLGLGGLIGLDAGGQFLRIPGGSPGASIVSTQITDSGATGRQLVQQAAAAGVFGILGLADPGIVPERIAGATNDTDRWLAALALAQASGRPITPTAARLYDLAGWPAAGFNASGALTIVGDRATLRPPAYDAVFLRPQASFDIEGLTFQDGWRGLAQRLGTEAGVSITDARWANIRASNVKGHALYLECPVNGLDVDLFVVNGMQSRAGDIAIGAIRIGENDDAKQATWRNLRISRLHARSVSATGATTCYPVLLYGMDAIMDRCTVVGSSSVDAGCIPFYTKLQWHAINACQAIDYTSTGTLNDAADVVGFSIKGDIVPSTTVSPEGRGAQVVGCIARVGGVSGVKGTGFRTQCHHSTFVGCRAEDMGFAYFDMNDFGSHGSALIGCSGDGFYFRQAEYGVIISSRSGGHRIIGGHLSEARVGVRVDGLFGGGPDPHPNPGNANRVLIQGTTIVSGRAGSSALRLGGDAGVTDVKMTDCTVDVKGSVVVNDGGSRERLQVVGNDLQGAAAAGATLWSGPIPGDTYLADNKGWNHHTFASHVVANGASGTVINHAIAGTGLATGGAIPTQAQGKHLIAGAEAPTPIAVESLTDTTARLRHNAGIAVVAYFEAMSPYAVAVS